MGTEFGRAQLGGTSGGGELGGRFSCKRSLGERSLGEPPEEGRLGGGLGERSLGEPPEEGSLGGGNLRRRGGWEEQRLGKPWGEVGGRFRFRFSWVGSFAAKEFGRA